MDIRESLKKILYKLDCILKNTNSNNSGGSLGDPSDVLNFLNYPFVNKGFSEIITGEKFHITQAKHSIGGGLDKLRDIEKVEVAPGEFEYWAIGQSMNIFRYDENMNLLGQITGMYGSAFKTNNLIQYTHDMYIDYANDKIYFALMNRHVVRVYRFSTIRDGSFISGNKGSGGHLYDIGIENTNNYWLNSTNGTTTHAGEGYLYNPYGIEKNPLNGNIIILNQYGSAETQTSNVGFIAEYSPVDGSFQRSIVQYNGTNTDNGNVSTLFLSPTSMTIINNILYVGNNDYYINKYDLQNLTLPPQRLGPYYNNYDNSNHYVRHNKLEVDTDNNLLVCHQQHSTNHDKNGVFKIDENFNVIGQVGNSKDILDTQSPYKLQNVHCVVNVGDRGLGVGDWYIIGNGSNNYISLVCLGKVSDGSILPEYKTYFETDGSLESAPPTGWSITEYPGSDSIFDETTNKVLTPIESIENDENLIALIEKI